jgi:hypothetical protein
MASGASAELLINWRTFLDRAVVLEVAAWLASARRARSRRSTRRFLTCRRCGRSVQGGPRADRATEVRKRHRPAVDRHLGALKAKHGAGQGHPQRLSAYAPLLAGPPWPPHPPVPRCRPNLDQAKAAADPADRGRAQTPSPMAQLGHSRRRRSDGLGLLMHWLDLGAFSKRRSLDRSLVRVRLRLQDTTRRCRSQISTAASS